MVIWPVMLICQNDAKVTTGPQQDHNRTTTGIKPNVVIVLTLVSILCMCFM